jgi:hypothetical protein
MFNDRRSLSMRRTSRGAGGPGTVYLLHFDVPRLRQHQAGGGARLLQVLAHTGIGWTLARTWTGTRERERQPKRQGGASRRCPICRAEEKDAGR